MKRIAISGPHSSGKTTLLYGLAHELKKDGVRVVVLGEAARDVSRLGFPLNLETTFESQLLILMKMIEGELVHSNSEIDVLLSDRSVIDQIPYSRLGKLNVSEFEEIMNIIKSYLKVKPYDLIIRLEGGNLIEDDGVREKDVSYLALIKEEFIRIYNDSEFWKGVEPITCMWIPQYKLTDIDREINKITDYYYRCL